MRTSGVVAIVLLASGLLAVGASSAWLPHSVEAVRVGVRGQVSVSERQAQHGPTVRARFRPYFAKAGVAYPPARVTLAAFKQERRLEVYAQNPTGPMRFVRSYPILAASGTLGPKLREGDRQVPEGVYRIESLNPNSAYHLSLRLNYPSTADKNQAKRDGRKQASLGSDIMIHGSNRSIGCLAMGDPAAEDLFILAADTGLPRISVLLCPVDFRASPIYTDSRPWVQARYNQLKAALNRLPVPAQ